jgi:hypothetical protein
MLKHDSDNDDTAHSNIENALRDMTGSSKYKRHNPKADWGLSEAIISFWIYFGYFGYPDKYPDKSKSSPVTSLALPRYNFI